MFHRPAHPALYAPGGTAVAPAPISLLTELELGELVDDAPTLLPMPDVLEHGASEPFRYCLNTSTLRGHNLTLPELVDIAASAGYEAIEPWVDELEKHEQTGGNLRDLGMRIRDMGLTVEGGIGFFDWIVDDDAARLAGLDQARQAMTLLSKIGGKRVAAPPWNAHKADATPLNLLAAAERYRTLLEIGDKMGVIPQVEVWGFSKNLSRLGEAAFVAMESGHPDANILADTYHLYKGGSPLSALAYVQGDKLPVVHVNDYPAISPADITDADRVFPGDGVAPLTPFFRTLRTIGFKGVLSLELFNKEYYAREPLHVAKEGLEKLREAVQKSF